MEIRRRVKNLVVSAKPKFKKPPLQISKSLAHLEGMARYQRWLRGVLSVLAIASFAISLVAMQDGTVEQLSDASVTLLTLAGEVSIFQVYKIKAQYAGVTDPIYRDSPSVLHSPHLPSMIVEMFVWLLHSPPFLSYLWEDAETLDFFVWMRLYTVLLYLNHVAFGHRTFCRAISAVADIPLSTSFFLRTAFIFDTFRTSIAILFAGWMSLALLFSKCENVDVWESMYFCFVTAATIGYGDISPKTTQGRVVAFFAWVFGLTVVAWVVGLVHEALSLSTAEQNLFLLFQANEMCNVIPVEAATTIQRAFRLYRARRHHRSMIVQTWMGYRLTAQVNALRGYRRRLRSTEASFMAQLSTNDRDAPEDRRRPTPNAAQRSRMSPANGIAATNASLVSPNGVLPTPRSIAATDRSRESPLAAGMNPPTTHGGVERLAQLESELDRMIAMAENLLRAKGVHSLSETMRFNDASPPTAAHPEDAPKSESPKSDSPSARSDERAPHEGSGEE